MRFSAAARRQAPRGPQTAEKSRQGAVSAGLNDLFGVLTLLEALPGVRLALRRVLRLRAHLVAHAVAPRVALLRLAGLARLGHRGLHLGRARLAGLRVLRLGAHLRPHACAALLALLAFAGRSRLLHRRLHLRHALLAGLGVLRLRAVEMAFALALHLALRRLGIKAGAGRKQRGADEHGKFHDRSLLKRAASAWCR